MQVWNNTAYVEPEIRERWGGFEVKGCYKGEGGVLKGWGFKDANMTVGDCVEGCKGRKETWRLAGLQDGVDCVCGAKLETGAEDVGREECAVRCAGDGREVCGGKGTVLVYQRGV